jgi:hypothetical protein
MRLDLRTAAEQLCRSVRLIARRAAAAEANQPTVYILRPYQPIPLVGQNATSQAAALAQSGRLASPHVSEETNSRRVMTGRVLLRDRGGRARRKTTGSREIGPRKSGVVGIRLG